MNPTALSRLEAEYQAALQSYLDDDGSQTNWQKSHELGAQAVAMGLETLGLAKLHDQAVAMIFPVDAPQASRAEGVRRAAGFFVETLVPIEKTHPGAMKVDADIQQLNATLDQRTLDLAEAHRELRQQVKGRQTAESALRNSEQASSQASGDTQDLEAYLHRCAREILSTTEAERKVTALHINDEIAQTLLGINLRMLALKEEIQANDVNLRGEIELAECMIDMAGLIESPRP